jgi:glucoamylase
LPDGSGRVPDARGVQLDGTGWTLWGLKRWNDSLPAAERAGSLRQFSQLLDRSVQATLRALDTPSGLPASGTDFWEVKEKQVTLGTVAPLLAGLQACQSMYTVLGHPSSAQECASAAATLASDIRSTFGPQYTRYPHGHGEADASVAMLLPPFTDFRDPHLNAAFQKLLKDSRRAGGGYAPGTGWRNDGVSWTPETALYALSAAVNGDTATAQSIITWLGKHRTQAGSFPEKVLFDGSPAAVAPLSWTASVVLLTLFSLPGSS